MSGYTVLNMEKIFLENAKIEFDKAVKLMETVYIDDFDKNTAFYSCGKRNKECIKASILCLFSLALSIETSVNLIVKEGNYKVSEFLSISKKMRKIGLDSYEAFPKKEVRELLNMRNKYMHYDFEKKYRGSSFAEDYQIDLSFKNLERFRELTEKCHVFFKEKYSIIKEYDQFSDGIITLIY